MKYYQEFWSFFYGYIVSSFFLVCLALVVWVSIKMGHYFLNLEGTQGHVFVAGFAFVPLLIAAAGLAQIFWGMK